MQRKKINVFLGTLFLLIVTSFINGCTNPVSINEKQKEDINSQDGLTSFKPSLLFSNLPARGMARVATGLDSNLTKEDYFVILGCPAISGFIDSGSKLNDGNTFTVNFIGSDVNFTINYFSDGSEKKL